MRLVVAKYVADEAHSLDCILCDESDNDKHYTVVIFAAETGNSFSVCPEHLDEMVTIALKRHRDGLRDNNHFWYLDEDPDPWAE